MQKVAAALVKAQRQFSPALKSATNPHFKTKYADLSACVEAVLDSLNAAGVFLMQRQHPAHAGGGVVGGLLRRVQPQPAHGQRQAAPGHALVVLRVGVERQRQALGPLALVRARRVRKRWP